MANLLRRIILKILHSGICVYEFYLLFCLCQLCENLKLLIGQKNLDNVIQNSYKEQTQHRGTNRKIGFVSRKLISCFFHLMKEKSLGSWYCCREMR